MNSDERRLIDGLFDRLGEAERQGGARDAEAERLIAGRIGAQSAAPYYLAQTVIVQDRALRAAKARIDELESAATRGDGQAGGGSFLGGMPGSPARPGPADIRSHASASAAGPWGAAVPAGYAGGAAPYGSPPMPSRAGSFLGGAAQTAVGVAGGVMLGSMLGSLFSGGHPFGGGFGGLGGGETLVENNVTENFYGDAPDAGSGLDVSDDGYGMDDTVNDDGGFDQI